MEHPAIAPPIALLGEMRPGYAHILSEEALAFVAALHERFNARRLQLLQQRRQRQARLDAGELPDFLPHTLHIRQSDWKVAPAPADLLDRRVEITGPVSRKMVINALNSGANVFMADFEDASSPTWHNMVDGQINLFDAVRRTLSYDDPSSGKSYRLAPRTATLMVRPRGWHLSEKHLLLEGQEASASLFDFGLFCFHNAQEALKRGTGPYFYLPKLESHLEARLWNDVFVFAQQYLGLPQGSIKATVLIETLLAAFEADEILYELREHSAGLNCGRWDYIFSIIKKCRQHPDFLMPDRAQVTMQAPCMKAYAELVVQVCHRRGIHAMGGMAAQVPIKHDEAAHEAAMKRVAADKEREASMGHDGTWVAHPGLVPVAKEVFDRHMPEANQIGRQLPSRPIEAKDLLEVPRGSITMGGLKTNVDVGIRYLAAWIQGNGCVQLYNLMEDAATAEISRAQVWQWLRHRASLDDGTPITPELVQGLVSDTKAELLGECPDESAKTASIQACELFLKLSLAKEFEEFLTLPAYALL
jgi:malate synthase